jgi:Tol biopolymer transport system component
LLWKAPLYGGAPVRLTDYSSLRPTVSPDGKFVACIYYDEQVSPKRWRNAVISIDGGPPLKVFDRPQYANQYPHWTADGRALLYVGAPTYPANIWLQPVEVGQPKQLTNFTSEQIFRFAVSPDGKWLAVARGGEPSDVVLISDATEQ